MNNTFDFVGKIVPCKETENFKPYEKRKFDSGWTKTTLKFNAVCGSNRHLLEVGVFTPPKIEETTIYTTIQTGDGKYENTQIHYDDRFDPETVQSVPRFKKFIIDTELPKRRGQLKEMLEYDSFTDEQIAKFGVHTHDECKAAYEKSCKRKHEYIWEYDFVEALHKLINNDNYKSMMWHITGTYELEYSPNGDQWYRKFKPDKIYRAYDDDTPKSQGEFVVVFNDKAVDDNDFADNGKIHINGFVTQYLGKPYKKNCYAPMMFTIDGSKDEAAHKKAEAIKRLFTFPSECEAEYRELGIVCNILDGAQVVELTEDMLTDEQKENLEVGLITMDDIKQEIGKPVYGDKVTDIVITGLRRGFTKGAADTVLTSAEVCKPKSDLDEQPTEAPEPEKKEVVEDSGEDDIDIFADDEI